MKPSIVIITVLVLVSVARPCFAHRLDEYLQATKLTINRDHIGMDLTLTPGVAVVSDILKSIDADQDGRISDAEQTAYIAQVRDDLTLSLDNVPVPIEIGTVNFPEVRQMTDGLGEIIIRLDAAIPTGTGVRHLVFENRHQKPISVYLANCLVPSDPSIRITSQSRSYDQSVYRLEYEEVAAQSPTAATARAAGTQSTSSSLYAGYVLHGIGHILTGYDHLLFVSALVLAASSLWDLVKVVSTFTVAHTLTLTLAAIGLVHVPGRVVEPLIAASIVFVAFQNVFWPKQAQGWGRLGAAFFFGLFHGLGFAGGLLETMQQLPGSAMLLSIGAFSVGVELGHQAIVLPLFALLTLVRRAERDGDRRAQWSASLRRFGSAGITLAGFYYLVVALMPSI